MLVFDKQYIDGTWVRPASSAVIDVIDPATEAACGRVPAGTGADVDAAVAAARRAFSPWSALSYDARGKYLDLLAQTLDAKSQLLADVITGEVGCPASFSVAVQIGLPTATLSLQSGLLRQITWREDVESSVVVREAAGVVAAITPWNFPLHQIAAKVGPALAAGCTVVLKPSEVAPLNAFLFAEAVHEAGLPAGVFNLVCGTGTEVGEPLVSHAEVDVVSLTGSTRAGRRVGELASRTVKRVTLELGGKSPNVLLDDADFEQAVADGLFKAFVNSGQTCAALTRMIVPRRALKTVEEIAVAAVANHPLVDPASETDGIRPKAFADKLNHIGISFALGPLVSQTQYRRVIEYLHHGVGEGARLLTGGPERPAEFDRGFFVQPTVFSNTTPAMSIVREEIFGPVLCLQPYDDEAEAVTLANDTQYGLSAAVWSGDRDRAEAIAHQIRAGQVEINGGPFNPFAPFGGYKQSGNGRELGRWGIEEYLETKSLQLG